MTKEDIIRMAREVGLTKTVDCCGVPNKFCGQDQWRGNLAVFAALVAAAERESCAKVVEASPSYDWHRFACEAAAAIRARGQQ